MSEEISMELGSLVNYRGHIVRLTHRIIDTRGEVSYQFEMIFFNTHISESVYASTHSRKVADEGKFHQLSEDVRQRYNQWKKHQKEAGTKKQNLMIALRGKG